jgi:hypothetical protein
MLQPPLLFVEAKLFDGVLGMVAGEAWWASSGMTELTRSGRSVFRSMRDW